MKHSLVQNLCQDKLGVVRQQSLMMLETKLVNAIFYFHLIEFFHSSTSTEQYLYLWAFTPRDTLSSVHRRGMGSCITNGIRELDYTIGVIE